MSLGSDFKKGDAVLYSQVGEDPIEAEVLRVKNSIVKLRLVLDQGSTVILCPADNICKAGKVKPALDAEDPKEGDFKNDTTEALPEGGD